MDPTFVKNTLSIVTNNEKESKTMMTLATVFTVASIAGGVLTGLSMAGKAILNGISESKRLKKEKEEEKEA